MITKVGHSTNKDSDKQGIECVTKSKISDKSKLGLVFTSCNNDHSKIVEGIRSKTQIPVIGMTSSDNLLVPGAILETKKNGYCAMMNFESEELIVGVGSSKRGTDPRESGRKAAKEALKSSGLMKVPNYFYMVASPGEENEYLLGIQDIIGRVKFFGGSAADDKNTGNWKIICNDAVITNGVAVAFFYTNDEMITSLSHDYKETSNVGVITKISKTKELIEINNTEPLQIYLNWTNKNIKDLDKKDFINEIILNPIGIKTENNGIVNFTYPLNTSDKNNVLFGNNVDLNTAIVQFTSTTENLINSFGKSLRYTNRAMYEKPSGYIIMHSTARKIPFDTKLKEVHKILEEKTKGKPYIVAFTYGEYGYNEHSANQCTNLSLSFTGFSE
ncbi:MAG: FIST N-terminal domain-containing protein [bacterium]